ncbi:MAG TPA: hypothetical protein VFT49_00055 [Candidatus Saccharimonadales bacterium]|nr:hypothetical protein [Candidatus Saccharimonadales bacterium]
MFQKWLEFELRKLHGAIFLAILLVVFVISQFVGIYQQQALADELPNRSLQVINPLPSETSAYNFSFDLATAGTLGSIKFEFCANNSIYGTSCDAPTGFSANAVALSSQSGVSGFSLVSGMPPNVIVIGRSPSNVPAQSVEYLFNNVLNTNVTGTSYVRISTYASSDATGGSIDQGGIAYPITSALDISTEVPQYLEFCTGVIIANYTCASASGDQINFGDFSTQGPSSATSQFMAATNANSGYNIYVNGNSLTSGNNVIDAITTPSASKSGTNQFGLNLRANSDPGVGTDPQGPGLTAASPSYNQPNLFDFKNGDILASVDTSDSYRKFTVSYLVNISPSQPAGDYVSTMYFICLANF